MKTGDLFLYQDHKFINNSLNNKIGIILYVYDVSEGGGNSFCLYFVRIANERLVLGEELIKPL